MDGQIGPYSIIRRLGSGGMAVVYLAHHEKLDRDVAVKVMHANFADDEDLLERFRREARIVASLDHPNIVPVHDFDDTGGQPYLVMRHIAGRTLKYHLNKRVLSLDEILKICGAIAHALTYAHENGVLHRDVKPSNVILEEPDLTPYLTDFGLARVLAQSESSMSRGMIVGTPHYLSPEQASGEIEVGPGADVYALGVMLYEMIVGRVPFSAETPHAIIYDHIYTPPPSPKQANPEVPENVANVLLQALAKHPDERYETPDDLINALQTAVDAAGLEGLSEDRSAVADRSLPTLRREARKRVTTEMVIDADSIGSLLGRFVSDQVSPRVRDGLTSAFEQTSNVIRSAFSPPENRPYRAPTEAELETQIRQRAKKRVAARRVFRNHTVAFAVINALLIAASLMGTGIAETAILSDATSPTEVEIALTAVNQPWVLMLTLFWAGGLASHWVATRNMSAGAEERRDKMLDHVLIERHGPNWPDSIMEADYQKAERTVKRLDNKRTGFRAHIATFLFVNLGFFAGWLMTRQILHAVINAEATAGASAQELAILNNIADVPFVLLVTLAWGVGLVIHGMTTTSGVQDLETEIERERSIVHNRRTPKPKLNVLQDDPPVRLNADGELTNSTVDVWGKDATGGRTS